MRRRGFGVAHPGFLGEPFVLDPACRAVDPREEHRLGVEALAIGNDAGRDVAAGVRAFDHNGAQSTPHAMPPDSIRRLDPSSRSFVLGSIAVGCDEGLTLARRYRDIEETVIWCSALCAIAMIYRPFTKRIN